MPIYAGKVYDMRTLLKYAEKNAAIYMRNMRQSLIRVKLASLAVKA